MTQNSDRQTAGFQKQIWTLTVMFIALLWGNIYGQAQTNAEADAMKKRLENQFQGFVARGDFAFSGKNYQEAKGNYQKALEMDPTSIVIRQKIQRVDSILLVNNAYESAISRADYFFKAKKFPEAKQFYINAAKIKPGVPYTGKQIDYIDSVLNIKNELAYLEQLENFHFQAKGISEKENYNSYIHKADSAFTAKDYHKAARYYETALLILPGEPYPKGQREKIYRIFEEENRAKQQIQESEQAAKDTLRHQQSRRFYQAIAKANQAIKEKQFDQAIGYYNQAATAWPEKKGDVDQLIQFVTTSKETLGKNTRVFNQIVADGDREFNAQNYSEALSYYKRANQLNTKEAYTTKQIRVTDSLIVVIEKPFNQVMNEARLLADKNLFDEAIKKYQEAAKLKPVSKEPPARSNELTQKRDNIKSKTELTQQNQERYLEVIKKADLAFKNNDLQEALVNYKLANNLRPLESYPKEKITELTETLSKQQKDSKASSDKELSEKYLDALQMADKLFKMERWNEAKEFYKKAYLLKPNENYAFSQMKFIDEKIGKTGTTAANTPTAAPQNTSATSAPLPKVEEKTLSKTEIEQNQQVKGMITQADQAFAQGNYGVARVYYQRALAIKDPDGYAQKQLDQITKALAAKKDEVQNQEYKTNLKKADEAFQKKEFSVARFFYQQAQKISPSESYPKTQLTTIDNMETELSKQEKEKHYKVIIQSADSAYFAENFPLAKYKYNQALELIPNDPYALEKLSNILKVQNMKQTDKESSTYQTDIKTADEAFTQRNYAKAGFYYKKALKTKPDEVYPQEQLKKINELTK